jgi:hypothetical protein
VGGSFLLLNVFRPRILSVWGAIMVATVASSVIAFFAVRARFNLLVGTPVPEAAAGNLFGGPKQAQSASAE